MKINHQIPTNGPIKRLGDQAFQKYVDWRRDNQIAEKHCYKTSDTVLLTFDDYASADQADVLLDILDRSGVRAMFFAQGNWAEEEPTIYKKFRAAGHIIGNHTYTHADLRHLTDSEVIKEISQGPSTAPWFRPPYGSYNKHVRQLVHQQGYVICYWTIDSQDWSGQATAKGITQRVLSRLDTNAVILFHAHIDATIEALPGIIEGIRAQGYKIDSPSDPLWQPPAL